MTKIRTLQIYRGTTAQNNAYTGSAGELTMDTTTNELRLHDGTTVGGHIIGPGGEVVDFQEPTAANNYTWYRKYASGWVEQGGTCEPLYAGATVSFPISMTNTNYQFQLSIGQGQLTGTVGAVVDNRTTTGMTVYSNWSSTIQPSYVCWQVSGMAA